MTRHTFRCPMRWSDVDAFGHVNNVVFLRYLEEARVDMLFTMGEQLGLTALAEGMVIARVEVDYRRPLRYRAGGIDIEVWVSEITGGKFVLDYTVRDDEAVYAEARSVLVPFDLHTQRPRRVSEQERDFLERFVDATAAARPPR